MSSSAVYHPEEFAASIAAHKAAVKRDKERFLAEMAEVRRINKEMIQAYVKAHKKFQ